MYVSKISMLNDKISHQFVVTTNLFWPIQVLRNKYFCDVTKSAAVNLFFVYGRNSVAIAEPSLVTNILAAYYFFILQESM
jgi:hypothetical protein